MHSFVVVATLPLIVYGSPEQAGTVSPDYNWYLYPSGCTVQASAGLYSDPTHGARWRCAGWTGSGSAPAAGASNAFSFTLSQPSVITWNWVRQWNLAQTSTVAGVVNVTTWWDQGSTGATVAAPAECAVNATHYSFACWRLDGNRQPDPTHTAVNPVSNVPMTAPHTAAAVYLPSDQDSDGNGLPDWWEYFYFGSTGTDPSADPDGDGASNLSEYLDRTDPRRADSTPSAPGIVHVPLTDPQQMPAPYLVSAAITDNFAVASVTLNWSRNGSPYVATNMTLTGAPGIFQAAIPPPGTNGDTFTYCIVASDFANNTVTNGPWSFRAVYAVMSVTPADLIGLVLPPDTETNIQVQVGNAGNTCLVADVSIAWAGRRDDFEQGAAGWTHGGTNDLWNLSSRRFSSPSNAWYCGNAATGLYGDSMHACLYMPPTFIGTASKLSFRHWIESELDTQTGLAMHAWDGGIVEISTDGGAHFLQMAPQGGYPYQITGWWESPWDDGTPCFAGSGGWQTAVFDLSAYAGRTVVIRFHFGSDSNTGKEGWYIDDVAVTQDSGTHTWISFAPTNVVVDGGQSTNIVLHLSSAGIPTGNRSSSLHVSSDASVAPLQDVPVMMKVRSPPVVGPVAALQTSTNAEGLVTLSSGIYDADGDLCSMEVLWSDNGAATWATGRIQSATATTGTPGVRTNAVPQLIALSTWNGTNIFTNTVTALWNTLLSAPPVTLSTATLVRARGWDGTFWGNPVTSQPFVVDNQPPLPPAGLTSASHVANAWSINPVISAQWLPASDGNGIGGCSYLYGFAGGQFGMTQLLGTSDTQVVSRVLSDGGDWWVTVIARDAFGNRSAPAMAGPYRIDTTPPSCSNAVVTVAHSPFGNYIVSQSATSSWTGFADAGSGIQGYFYSTSNNAGTRSGAWTSGLSGLLQNLPQDQTNRIYVWAQDNAGLIGDAASAPILVLSPGGDWDHDGLSNAQEELAGTDAGNASSLFKLSAAQSLSSPTDTCFLVRWNGVAGRRYSLSWLDSLTPTGTVWNALPGATDIPGCPGTMTYTDRTGTAVLRFYRISVASP